MTAVWQTWKRQQAYCVAVKHGGRGVHGEDAACRCTADIPETAMDPAYLDGQYIKLLLLFYVR